MLGEAGPHLIFDVAITGGEPTRDGGFQFRELDIYLLFERLNRADDSWRLSLEIFPRFLFLHLLFQVFLCFLGTRLNRNASAKLPDVFSPLRLLLQFRVWNVLEAKLEA